MKSSDAESKRIRIIHCISGLAESGGGPSRSVPALAAALLTADADVNLMTIGSNSDAELPEQVRMNTKSYAGSWPRALAGSGDLGRALLRKDETDVFHVHGLWEMPAHYVARAAKRASRPYIITPRGMLEPWALRHHRWRKAIIARLYQDRDLRGAACMHALNQNELRSFRDYGLTNPVAVLPNGVNLQEIDAAVADAPEVGDILPEVSGRPYVLFLSRLHPKKGLVPLVDAWAGIHREHPDWLLVIAGPEQLGHRAEVEHRVREGGVADSVVFTGALYGAKKWAALAGAEFFVLPSFSEGFSVAVLEAMACSLPVLITPGCNFPEVAEAGAGVICEPEPQSVEHALRQLVDAEGYARNAMGHRARRLIEEHYTWDSIAARMIGVYKWLLGEDSRPACIDTC